MTAIGKSRKRSDVRKQLKGKPLRLSEQADRAFAIIRPLLAIVGPSREIIKSSHPKYREIADATRAAVRADIEDVLTHFNDPTEKPDPWYSRSSSYRNKRLANARNALERLRRTIQVPEYQQRLDDLDQLTRDLMKPGYAKRNFKQQWAANEAVLLLWMRSASPKLEANAGGALVKLAAVLYGDAQADLRHHYLWPSLRRLRAKSVRQHFDISAVREAVRTKQLHPLWGELLIKRYSRAPAAKKAGPQ